MRIVALTALWLALASTALAQQLVCVQQPASGLYYRTWQDSEAQASLWVCAVRGGTASIPDVHYAMRHLGPFSAQSIVTWGEWTNRVSWKGRLGTAIDVAALLTPLANIGEINEIWLRTLLASAPGAIARGREYLQGRPNRFIPATADPPFFPVYTQASDQIAFEAFLGPPEPPPLPTEAAPTVLPASELADLPILPPEVPWPAVASEGPTLAGYYLAGDGW